LSAKHVSIVGIVHLRGYAIGEKAIIKA